MCHAHGTSGYPAAPGRVPAVPGTGTAWWESSHKYIGLCRYVFPMCNLSLEINLRATSARSDLSRFSCLFFIRLLSCSQICLHCLQLLLMYLCVCIIMPTVNWLWPSNTMDVWENWESLPPTQRPVHHVCSCHSNFLASWGVLGCFSCLMGVTFLSIVLIYILSATFCGCLQLTLGWVRFRF